jgi:hypothetical protein
LPAARLIDIHGGLPFGFQRNIEAASGNNIEGIGRTALPEDELPGRNKDWLAVLADIPQDRGVHTAEESERLKKF